MSRRIDQNQLIAQSEIVAAPAKRACTDQNFGLPAGIFMAMGLFFFGFVVVLATTFRTNMGVSYGVVIAFLAAFFAIPVIFVKTSPKGGAKALKWSSFRARGISTATGRTGAGEATVLVLALPFLILCWAIAVATIAVVR